MEGMMLRSSTAKKIDLAPTATLPQEPKPVLY